MEKKKEIMKDRKTERKIDRYIESQREIMIDDQIRKKRKNE